MTADDGNQRNTPPYGTPLPWAIEANCAARHDSAGRAIAGLREQLDEARVAVIVGVGENGKGGRLENLEADMAEIRKWQEQQRAFLVKLVLAIAVATSAGAGVAQAVMKAIGVP